MRSVNTPLICRPEAELVDEAGAEEVEEDEEDEEELPEPAVEAALLVDGLPAVEEAEFEAVKVAMDMVVFLAIAVPVAALAAVALLLTIVTGAIGTVLDAVPFAESVLLMYGVGLAVADDEEAELTADEVAPWILKGPK